MEPSGMPTPASLAFDRVDLGSAGERDAFIAITGEYFDWMNGEIVQFCGFSIPDLVGMSLADYVLYTTDIASRIPPEDGGIYFQQETGGPVLAMGGLRRLPDGAAEIVRIYTRPAFRGRGLGSRTIEHLIGEARRLGYANLRLDTAKFMLSAQKIYRAAGFELRGPYAGAEPPERLLPYWLFMDRPL